MKTFASTGTFTDSKVLLFDGVYVGLSVVAGGVVDGGVGLVAGMGTGAIAQ
jgi:hypothetical protein